VSKDIPILYIDDNPMDLALVKDSLEREHEGFHLTPASSKKEFEEKLGSGSYDLVLTDFNIQGFEGLDVIKMVKEKDPAIPVIIVTGTGSETVAVESMKQGASDYIIKTPAHIKKLPQTIHRVLRQKETEKILSEKEELMSRLMDTIPIPVFYKDQDGLYLGVNRAFEVFFGRSREELVGKRASDLVPPAQAKIFKEKDQELIESEGEQVYESDLRDARRNVHRVKFFKSVYNDRSGETAGIIGAVLDITELMEKQKQLEKHGDRLEEMVGERTRELEEKNQELRRYYDAFVGRELRMKELYEENQELKNKLKK